ncbi:MAG: 16S rRNA (cytidine(1402)-2'-O)-methyltransferase [Gemmatimonadota bacterium]|nr:16S rRNA (cytidine(1402)-2'-O)-methyltransferase [Gemmatimonadota bacterium]
MSDDRIVGRLFVVGTPIGNLDDLTDRARETLRAVAVCYAEDTRRTGRLLARIGVDVVLRSLHAHNEESRLSEIMERLGRAEDVALVSDAGTPTVSDPGARVVAAVLEAGGRVSPVPGPSAVSAALSVSGLPGDRCYFAGFGPRRSGERDEWLEEVARSRVTVVMFEAPGRLGRLLAHLAERGAGDRRAVVCRELTKLHEEVAAGTIADLATVYDGERVKGEVTLVMEGAPPTSGRADDEAVRVALAELAASGAPRSRIARELRDRFGLARNEAYRLSHEESGEPSGD